MTTQTWVDGPDVILQADLATVRVTPSILGALADEAAARDDATARWRGHDWDRDHLASAVDLAVSAGLLDTCPAVDGGRTCERPVFDLNETRCRAHRKE